jgi:hypothetical protein
MKKTYANVQLLLSSLIVAITLSALQNMHNETPNAGLITPQGFTAVKLIEGIGKVRHIAIIQIGYIYARVAVPVNGQGTLLLQQNDGKATVKLGFGNYGGTGVRLYKDYLYTASNSEIFRYKIDKNEQVEDTNALENHC